MQRLIHVDLKCMAPTPAALKRDIARWAGEGATGVVFEWENMFPYPELGDATRQDRYTPAEVREILDSCRRYGLTAIPLMQTLGHLEWLLAHERYRPLREFPDDASEIRACDRDALRVLEGCLSALLEAHGDSPYVHLGADEAMRLKDVDRADCSARRDGAGAVFLRHMQPLFARVLAAGKRPIVWDDMPLRHPEHIGDFPGETIFCDWMYSQTTEYAATVYGWDLERIGAESYGRLPEDRKRLFEKYWRMDATDFPRQVYQFPYLPFLRDRGFDVLGGPATLYAAHALAGPDLPSVRANQREWLRATRRFGGLGAMNTCWQVRGALRECTRLGHRSFLIQGANTDPLLGDGEVARRCWDPMAGEAAAGVARAVDGLMPPVDPVSRTLPLWFDVGTRTHRPKGYDTRGEALRKELADLPDDAPAAVEHAAARERAASAATELAPFAARSDEAMAWQLGCREVDIRAAVWLAAFRRAKGKQPGEDLGRTAERIRRQADDVAAFMADRYRTADIGVVRADRYESLLRLVTQLSEA